jgi:hypothetical protein
MYLLKYIQLRQYSKQKTMPKLWIICIHINIHNMFIQDLLTSISSNQLIHIKIKAPQNQIQWGFIIT